MGNKDMDAVLAEMETYLLGKRRYLEYALTCLLAKGHLLIEDVPGVGKTTLAKSLANIIQADFNRVQFTSDLLPSDLLGVTVFHRTKSEFEFRRGPIFTNVLLTDEINRANPKTQSALLEAMHDAQISHDGITESLPSPFFVIATQNSKDDHGTFPLPESQLDRFLMKIHLGYPDEDYEKRVISGDYAREFGKNRPLNTTELARHQQAVSEVHVSVEVLDYLYRIVDGTRRHPAVRVGVSPRGGQALYGACCALAYIRGRDFVIPDDVLELVVPVFGHRITPRYNQLTDVDSSEDGIQKIFRDILSKVSAPV